MDLSVSQAKRTSIHMVNQLTLWSCIGINAVGTWHSSTVPGSAADVGRILYEMPFGHLSLRKTDVAGESLAQDFKEI